MQHNISVICPMILVILRLQIESSEAGSVSGIILVNGINLLRKWGKIQMNILSQTLPLKRFNYFIISLSKVWIVVCRCVRFRFMSIKPYWILWSKQVLRSSGVGTWQKVSPFMMIVDDILFLMTWRELKISLISLQCWMMLIQFALLCGRWAFLESVSTLVLSWRKH